MTETAFVLCVNSCRRHIDRLIFYGLVLSMLVVNGLLRSTYSLWLLQRNLYCFVIYLRDAAKLRAAVEAV